AGRTVVHLSLNQDALFRLEGTPLPQDAALDELRLKDVPSGADVKPGQRLDPLLHYVGRVDVNFGNSPGNVKLAGAQNHIDRAARTVTSTTGELTLDYGKGVLMVNAPQVQGLSGCLGAVGQTATKDMSFQSEMDLGHIVAVSLDNRPLAT